MNTVEIANRAKKLIMDDLFMDVNRQQCIMDVYLSEPTKENAKLSKISDDFINEKKDILGAVRNKGKILFFRKYEYEKILNQYLSEEQNIKKINKVWDAEEREKREKVQREQQQKIAKEQKEFLKRIGNLKWGKYYSLSGVVYRTKDINGKVVELYTYTNRSRKDAKKNFLYDKVAITVPYDMKNIVRSIESTNPVKRADQNVIIVKNRNIKSKAELEREKEKRKKKKISKEKANQVIGKGQKNFETEHIALEKIALQYNLKESTVQCIIGAVQNRCKYIKEKQCTLYDRKCSALYTDCANYKTALNDLKKQANKSKKHDVKPAKSNETVKSENTKKITPKTVPKEINKTQTGVKDINELPEIGLKDFVVRRAVFKCVHSNHQVKDIEAAIGMDDDGKKKLIRVVAGYCEQCKTYFILDSTYENLRKKGIILCRIWDEKSYTHNDYTNGMRLAQESILMQFGYNVSQQEGLSATSRQKILAVLIDNKVMTKNEIISYLDFFISQRSKQSSMELAISKWEADREFVEQYRAGEYTQYGVNAIHRRR